ncbi:MAG: cyclodeaminase/cyclohydrolase family protein [Bacillota bacterium]|nr:cyclodeaminase/cyclohydrolase family protein [Bacillota bacterium]
MLREMTLPTFVEKLASSDPVPGGGSVAALCSALSCALGSMVARLTTGKKNYEEHTECMNKLILDLDARSADFMQLIDKDASSFDGVMKAFKMPKDTEEQKAARTAAIQQGMKEASQVPLEVAEKGALLFEPLETLVKNGNANAQTDALVGTMLARTAILSALYNVKINLGSIKDEEFVRKTSARVAELEKLAVEREGAILAQSTL